MASQLIITAVVQYQGSSVTDSAMNLWTVAAG
jgi:hypothetical protein